MLAVGPGENRSLTWRRTYVAVASSPGTSPSKINFTCASAICVPAVSSSLDAGLQPLAADERAVGAPQILEQPAPSSLRAAGALRAADAHQPRVHARQRRKRQRQLQVGPAADADLTDAVVELDRALPGDGLARAPLGLARRNHA